MVASSIVEEVRRLLAEGRLSQRKVARAVGISRGTVAGIASGQRPDYTALRARREDPLEPAGPPARCPGCGGMVYMPCRLCHVKSLAAASPKRPTLLVAGVEPLGMQLKEEHRRRYEQVRAQREAADRDGVGQAANLP